MFESDQHEFDEEYAEASHPAPPSPPKTSATTPQKTSPASASSVTTAPARPAATATALRVAAPTGSVAGSVAVHEPVVEESEDEGQEQPEEATEDEEFVDAAEKPVVEAPQKKKLNLVLIGGFAALAIFAIFVLFTMKSGKPDGPPPGDLGPGIVAEAGLRGHLNTRWEGDAKTGRLAYQLRIEPMEDRWGAGFTRAITASPMPMSVNIRLLDSTGFALCGKEVDFRFDPQHAEVPVTVSPVGPNGKKLSLAERTAAVEAARQIQITQMRAAEVTREQGKDLFQNQTTDDGQITAVNVQGALPCSPDQFKRADYWDFNTNFPTLAQQAELLDPKAGQQAKESEAPAHPGRRNLAKPQDGFVIQGDDRVTGYDPVLGLLWAEQKTFAIDKRFGGAAASAWASNYTLIHYRCDQQANCALSAAGNATVLHARLNH
jgi:hypothetical protein